MASPYSDRDSRRRSDEPDRRRSAGRGWQGERQGYRGADDERGNDAGYGGEGRRDNYARRLDEAGGGYRDEDEDTYGDRQPERRRAYEFGDREPSPNYPAGRSGAYTGYGSDRQDRDSERDHETGARLGRDYERSSGDRFGRGPHQGPAWEGWSEGDGGGMGAMGRGYGSGAGGGPGGESGSRQAMGRMSGPHRGKGPKGYTRSDDRIREEVSDRLSDDDQIDASEITVTVSGGEVTLEGTVESREAKRAAEDCADRCSGVTHVQNNLRVRASGTGPERPQMGGTSGATGAANGGETGPASNKGRGKDG